MKTIRIELPMFPGFYESVFENSDTEYCAITEEITYLKAEEGIEYRREDFEFDHERRRQDIAQRFAAAFDSMTPDPLFYIKKDSVSIQSPQYYNYSTDRIFADAVMDDDYIEQLVAWCEENKEWLDNKLFEDNSSKPGYICFLSEQCNPEPRCKAYVDAYVESKPIPSDEYLPDYAFGWIANLRKEDPQYIARTLAYRNIQRDGLQAFREELYYLTLEEINDSEYLTIKK